MKGVFPVDELVALKAKKELEPTVVHVLQVPGLDAKRHLVILPNNLK
jgi:hypothetical protein